MDFALSGDMRLGSGLVMALDAVVDVELLILGQVCFLKPEVNLSPYA